MQAPSVYDNLTAGPRAAWPSRTSCSRAHCRWASTATAGRRSSSARTRRTGRRRPGDRRLSADAGRGPPRHRRARRRRLHAGSTYPRSSPRATGPRISAPTSASSSPGRTRWSRSSCTTRRGSCAATRRAQAIQFLMAQSWYTLWSVAHRGAVGAADRRPAQRPADHHVPLSEFLAYYLAVAADVDADVVVEPALVPAARASGCPGAALVLEVARWPIVLWAVINVRPAHQAPVHDHAKGDAGRRTPSGLRLYGPYFALAGVGRAPSSSSSLAIGHVADAGLSRARPVQRALMLACLLVDDPSLELGDLRRRTGRPRRRRCALRAGVAGHARRLTVRGVTWRRSAVAWAPLIEALG